VAFFRIRYQGSFYRTCHSAVITETPGWSIQQDSLIGPIFLATVFSAPLSIKRYRQDDLLFILCEAVIYSLILARAAAVLSYLAISANFPLVDQSLAAFDHALAFSWADYYQWTAAHETFRRVLVAAYGSLAIREAINSRNSRTLSARLEIQR